MVQELGLGQLLRSIYVNSSSPSNVNGLSAGIFNQAQASLVADGGGEAGVIYDSAIAWAQGFWPPTSAQNTTLANGTTVTAPLGGYQYVPVAFIDPQEDISLEGWTSCNAFTNWTSAVYSSPAFQQVARDNAAFLQSLGPIVGNRNVTLANFYNIW